MIKGFDTAARLNASQARKLREADYTFAIRYLVPERYSKALTRSEVDILLTAGFRIGLVWETTANRSNSGAASGLTDGRQAAELAKSMGVPDNTVIYFAVDYYPKADDYPRIAAYMIAAESAVRPYRLGIYGCFDVIEDMHRREIGTAYWQCVGWSQGKWSEWADIQQREWNVKTAAGTVDNNYCEDLKAAGLWGVEEGMIITGRRVRLYNNKSKKTPQAIKKETGCTSLINGGLFSLKTFKPACHLKIGGEVLAKDQYKYWGYGIKNGRAKLMQDYADVPDYIACCCMVRNGNPEKLIYNADMGDARQRTMFGTISGAPWGYVTLAPTTPEYLQKIALAEGLDDAIMLDGGASSWALTPHGELRGGRVAANYILFYDNCPYAEPTSNVKWGSIGEGAKWVQWQLNSLGANLTVDGIFGGKSVAALKVFQMDHKLEADGICGKLTRAELKR